MLLEDKGTKRYVQQAERSKTPKCQSGNTTKSIIAENPGQQKNNQNQFFLTAIL